MNLTSTDSPPEAWFSEIDVFRALSAIAASDDMYADVFLERWTRAGVRIEGGELVRAARGRDAGMAIRALDARGGTRAATATAIGDRTLRALAAEIAAGGGPRAAVVPGPLTVHRAPPAADPEGSRLEHRIALARLADRAAREVSPEIREVAVTLRDSLRRVAIAGSDGRMVAREEVRTVLAVEVVATRGAVTQSTFEATGGTGGIARIDEAAAARVARLAAERALRMVQARPAPAGKMPVVLAAEAGGTFVHEAVGHALEADLVLEGLSDLGERVGEVVAAPIVSVVDDATLPGANGSFDADDEGVLAQRTVLIDRGVLVGMLHDERTARVMGARSTGHGRRESFRHRPIVRMSNTMITPGDDDPAAILRDTPRGLYVVRMGGGEVDTITGQFVFEVNEAYLIDGGALGPPVRGATLAGDAAEVLMSIDRVGRDLGFGIGTCGKDGQDVPVSDGEPTIRIPELVIGGGQ